MTDGGTPGGPGPDAAGRPASGPEPTSATEPVTQPDAAATETAATETAAAVTAASETAASETAGAPAAPTAPGRGTPGIPHADESARGTPGIPRRPRGLSAPYIAGGDDPDITETRRRERPYMRLLIGMVAVIVGGTLVLTILAIASSILYR